MLQWPVGWPVWPGLLIVWIFKTMQISPIQKFAKLQNLAKSHHPELGRSRIAIGRDFKNNLTDIGNGVETLLRISKTFWKGNLFVQSLVLNHRKCCLQFSECLEKAWKGKIVLALHI